MKRVFCVLFLLVVCLCYSHSVSAIAEKHTVTFDMMGVGEQLASVLVNDGDSYLYIGRNDVPKADGYIFHCWSTVKNYPHDEVELSNTVMYNETPVTGSMTLYAVWYKIIDSVDISVPSPVAGFTVGTAEYHSEDYDFEYQRQRPLVLVDSDGAQLVQSSWFEGPSVFWLSDPSDMDSIFYGTFEDGKTYGVSVQLEPEFGYAFADDLRVNVNGSFLQPQYQSHDLCNFNVPIICAKSDASVNVFSGDISSFDEATVNSVSHNEDVDSLSIATGNEYPWSAIFVLSIAIFLVFVIKVRFN